MSSWQALGVILVCACLALVLFGLFRLPNSRVSRPLLGFALTGALWALGEAITLLARDLTVEQIGIATLYTGVIYMAPLWWMLALRWAEAHGSPVSRTDFWGRIPLAWATAMWLAALTNPWHGQFITPVLGGRNIYEPLWWAMAIPNYALIIGAFMVALWVVRRVRARTVRRQGNTMIAAGAVTLLANWLYVFGPEPSFNATLLVLGISGAILVLGMYREGLFGLLPVALPTVAEHDSDGLVIVRPGGRLSYANARAHELLAPIAPSEDTRFPELLRELLREADGSNVAQREGDWEEAWWDAVLQADGRLYCYGHDDTRWLRMRAQVVRGRGGQIMALCTRIRDVSAEQETEAELRRARRLESVAELARGVAHDFRNLLTIVRGNAKLLAAELGPDPRLQRKLDRILQSSESAFDLAEQLQLYVGGVETARTALDLSDIVREMSSLHCSQSAEPVGIRLELAPQPLLIEADRNQLRQALLNLLVNAREALGKSDEEIGAQTGLCRVDPKNMENLVLGRDRPAGEYAYVRVWDSGCGIDAETHERIFEPFFSTKDKQRGIGLSTVFGTARAHGALLQLETRPGRGSAFTLHFPTENHT